MKKKTPKPRCSKGCKHFRFEAAKVGVIKICIDCGQRIHVYPAGYTTSKPTPGLNSTKYKKDKAKKEKETLNLEI